MNEKIQEKLNQMRRMAAMSKKTHTVKTSDERPIEDSLSKAIRNPKEAAIFLAELEAAVKIAKAGK